MADNLEKIHQQMELHNILDGIGDGIILTGCKGRVLYINESARRILACEERPAIGEEFSAICPLQHLPTHRRMPDPVMRAMETGLPSGLRRDAGVVLPDGRMVYLSATCSPSVDNRGAVGGCSVILRDVTRMHRLELQVEVSGGPCGAYSPPRAWVFACSTIRRVSWNSTRPRVRYWRFG